MTQRDIAQELGVDVSAVCGWEKGKFRPDPTNAVKLTRLLPGLTFEAIYSERAA